MIRKIEAEIIALFVLFLLIAAPAPVARAEKIAPAPYCRPGWYLNEVAQSGDNEIEVRTLLVRADCSGVSIETYLEYNGQFIAHWGSEGLSENEYMRYTDVIEATGAAIRCTSTQVPAIVSRQARSFLTAWCSAADRA